MVRRTVWIVAFVFAATAGFAVAGTQQSARVEVPYEVSWAGKVLPAGEYTFKWQGDAADVDVTVLRGSQVVAQGRGRLEQLQKKSPANAVGTRRDDSGARTLTHVDFGGKTTILMLAQS
jgi:hypothetical protein